MALGYLMGGVSIGFAIVALLNFVSFGLEYLLLSFAYRSSSSLRHRETRHPAELSMFRRLVAGWKVFTMQPVAPIVVAYGLLGFTVLSPHGSVFTVYLERAWRMPTETLGIIRGLGAAAGIIPTFIFPLVSRRLGLHRASAIFVSFQASMLVGACVSLQWDVAFLVAFVLLSRIGLYGFELGQLTIRQQLVPEGLRGSVGGVGAAMLESTIVGIYLLVMIFPSTSHFPALAWCSCIAVASSAVLVLRWPGERLLSADARRESKSI